MKERLDFSLQYRIMEIEESYAAMNLEKHYDFTCGFLMAANIAVKDNDWSDTWGIKIEEAYIKRKNQLMEVAAKYHNALEEDKPF